jgi:hypothetical protein
MRPSRRLPFLAAAAEYGEEPRFYMKHSACKIIADLVKIPDPESFLETECVNIWMLCPDLVKTVYT